MFSGAKPKKKARPGSKEATLTVATNDGVMAADVKTFNNAKLINIFQNHSDGSDDKLLNQAINEALRILESKARREYGNFSSSLHCQQLPAGKSCSRRPVFVEPVLVKQKSYSTNASQKSVKFEDIFSSSSVTKRPPQLILLIGNSGFGKSTLSSRVVNDWAVKMSSFASRFRLVILFKLSRLGVGEKLEETLLKEFALSLSSECPTMSVVKILGSIREQLLIVLDGYDQMPVEFRPEVSALLDKQSFFYSSTILVTSRPDALTDRFTKNFQCFITIAPLTSDRRDQLIDKYFKTQPEAGKSIKSFLKNHQLRSLANESLEALSVLLQLFELGLIHSTQRDYQIVFEMSRILIRRSSQRENPDKHIEDEKLDSTIYRLGKLMLQKLKTNQISYEEQEFNILGSLKDAVSKSGLFQVRKTKLNIRWEVLSKAYIVCLSAYYLNEKLKKLKSVPDVHTFLRKNLGDANHVKTVVFKKHMGYLALWGYPSDILYVTHGTHSFFNGSFETMLNLKEVFGDMVLRFKALPKYNVYGERKGSLSFTETFAEMNDPTNKQKSFHFGNSRQESSLQNLNKPLERFSNVGYFRFSFAIDETKWGKEVTKHDVCNDKCLKANLLPLVVLKDDFIKTVKHKSWNIMLNDHTNCFLIEGLSK